MANGDHIHELELRLPVGTPETIDSAFLCRLGGAYLRFLSRVAEEQGRELSFTGIRLDRGSTRALFLPSDEETARDAADEAAPYVSGETEPPSGLEADARAVSDILGEGLAAGQCATVIIGPWKRPLAPRVQEERRLATDTVSVRVKVLRVGGVKPAVRVETASEPFAFTLTLSKPDDAPKLGALLYQEIDIVATVRRDDEDEKIVSGTLDEWAPLDPGSGVAAWREWFRQSCPEWEDVEDVNAELGRGDDEDVSGHRH